jgi:predicted nucleotidyltransferase
MRSAPSALLPILRSQVAGELLALLYLHPEAEYSLTEAATTIGASLNAVHYEAGKRSESGLLSTRKRGNLRLVRAVTDSLLTRPLTDLLAVTYGPLPVLTDLLADVDGIAEAYIYGSWAARYRGEPGPAPADVDVLVIGTADPDDLDEVAGQAQRALHRPVSIRRVRPETWNVANPAPHNPRWAPRRARGRSRAARPLPRRAARRPGRSRNRLPPCDGASRLHAPVVKLMLA